MEKEQYRKHYELEQDFWWFAGRRKIILNILESFSIFGQPSAHLDVGCGTGYDLQVFDSYFHSFGCDLFSEALLFCRRRGLKRVVQADAGRLPFQDASFGLVTLLDVLYHKNIKSDVEALKEAHRTLKKGGHLLITDSALNFLYSRHDIAFHARERYSKRSLRKRLEAAEFSVEKMSYFNFFLFPGIALVRILEKRGVEGRKNLAPDLRAVDPRLNSLLLAVLKTEAFLLKSLNLPVGSSILCLAKKG